MGKFTDLQKDVFSIFDSTAWKAEEINTIPANMTPVDSGNEFIRVSIIPSGNGVNPKSTSGILIVDIFTSANAGPVRSATIADKLDQFLCGKSIKTTSGGTTQLMISAYTPKGKDRDIPTLFWSTFTIPFTFSGVT